MPSQIQTDADAAIAASGVPDAITPFVATLNAAFASYAAAHPGDHARRVFAEQLNAVFANAGMPRWAK